MTSQRVRTTLIFCCTVQLALGGTACSRAAAGGAPSPAEGESFTGVYESGPNRSVFRPCGSDEQWYIWPSSTQARELRRLTSIQDMQQPGGGMSPRESAPAIRRAYAEVRGDTVAVTATQPAIPYEKELRLTRVVAVQTAQGPVCQ